MQGWWDRWFGSGSDEEEEEEVEVPLNEEKGGLNHLSHNMRKSVFGDCSQVRLKQACSATEAS